MEKSATAPNDVQSFENIHLQIKPVKESEIVTSQSAMTLLRRNNVQSFENIRPHMVSVKGFEILIFDLISE